MTDLTTLSVVDAAAAIRSGAITSETFVAACLERISARDGEVKAFAHVDPAHALALARAADDAQRNGRGTGPLNGVPVAVKDIIDTADQPTEHGSPVFRGNQPTVDARCVAALRNAGAVIIGKTVTTELATLTPGVTRNPLNLAHTPGGSSSGSAAAVADGMVPAALGTQTGGSVIRPASFCGVCGFKPTFGFIPRAGVLEQAKSLDTVGVFARTVDDLALLAEVLGQHDPSEPASYPRSQPRLSAILAEAWPLKPRFAFVKSAAWTDVAAPETREAFGELVEALGGEVEEVNIDHSIEKGLAAAKVVQNVELASSYGPLLDKAPSLISERLAGQIGEGRALKGIDYVAALARRDDLYRNVLEILEQHGTILTPAASGSAPKGLGSTGNPIFNAFWTFMGVPAVSLPILEIDGMPLGVQLIGARRDDGRLLRTARWLTRHVQ